MIPTPRASFYGALMGWEFEGSGGEPEYFVARLRGRDVAGLAPMPQAVEDIDGVWMTHVAVDERRPRAEAGRAAGGRVIAGPLDVPAGGQAGGHRRPGRRRVLRLGGPGPGGRRR